LNSQILEAGDVSTLPRATCEAEARVVLAAGFGAVSGAEARQNRLHEQWEWYVGFGPGVSLWLPGYL